MNRDTICVQGGYTPGNGEPRQIPIIQSTTFKYATSEDMGKLFDLEANGYFYSRLQNPTCDIVAKKICELEGGTAAMLTSSGQAANFFALFNICEAGDHIVASSTIYGGTFNLISVTMAKMGITATFVDPLCTEEELDAAFQPNTKAVFGETIANPALTVLDIEKFAKAAHAHGVPLIVDNTFPTPVNCRPFAWGADIVTHSTTKYMDGHGAAVGGAIVDSGKFDWMAHAEKFPGLCTPDDSYHGITYAERFGKEGAFITKATAQLMRDFGSTQSPMSAYMLNLGLESLHLREILDLRSAGEAARQPDAAVSGAHYQRICGMRYADGSEMDFSPAGIQRIAAEKAAYEAKAGHPVHDFYWFTDLYKQMPFGNPAYHELFRLLEEHRVPLLFHCTCGKDRTGIAAMLVLLALGVSREDAIADYMLTNVYRKAIIDKFMQDKPADQYDLLLPVEGVSESMGAGSIDVLLEKYPSYEAYFEAEYGLTTARLAALRDFYLE